jgi:hypothetical protein
MPLQIEVRSIWRLLGDKNDNNDHTKAIFRIAEEEFEKVLLWERRIRAMYANDSVRE